MQLNRTELSEWGCIVSGIVALLTALIWAFGLQPKSLTLSWFPVFSVIAAIVCAVLFYLGKKLPNASPTAKILPSEKSDSVAATPLLPSVKTWCDEMAEDDANRIRELVREVNQRKGFHLHPGSDPYIDIVTELWNGTVFHLASYGEISGHVTYGGRQLAGEPRVVVAVEPPLINLPHGRSVTLVVRQYLSAEVADMMQANRDRGVAIDFESVFVSFKILGPSTQLNTFRWQGPRFAIEDTSRV